MRSTSPYERNFNETNNKQSEVQQAHKIGLFAMEFTYLFMADWAVMKGKSSKNRGGKEEFSKVEAGETPPFSARAKPSLLVLIFFRT
jgi:hypothetical protein